MNDPCIADDHDNAGNKECHKQLVNSEVDTEKRNKENSVEFKVLPYAIISVIAISDRDKISAVGIVVSEHILMKLN